jgi:hypothetical protein
MSVFKIIDKSLPIRPVLDQGFIVFARAHYNGTRMVSFENPEAHYQVTEQVIFGRGESHIGYGKTIDLAFGQALHSFHQSSPNYKSLYTTKERTYEIKKVIARLDGWLISHRGKLRMVSDFDGTILARLEGLIDPSDSLSEYIVLEASGRTFYGTLLSVLEKPAISSGLHNLKVKTIKIKDVEEDVLRIIPVAQPKPVFKTYSAVSRSGVLKINPRVRVS